jgi:hypothetical protein
LAPPVYESSKEKLAVLLAAAAAANMQPPPGSNLNFRSGGNIRFPAKNKQVKVIGKTGNFQTGPNFHVSKSSR